MTDTSGLASKIIELDTALDAADIRHAFGGALALAFCTEEPRATADIDVNVFVNPTEADTVLGALPEGVSFSESDVNVIRRDGQARLWWNETPIDLFFGYHEFHEVAASRVRLVPFDGVTIPVLDCSDLAVFKAFFARTKDWADIEAAARAGSVDSNYALEWVAQLLGVDSPNYKRLEIALAAKPEPADQLHEALGYPDQPSS